MSGAAITDETDAADAAALARGKHIIDILIEERAPKLVASPMWPLYRSVLYPLLKEPNAKRMADSVAGLSGRTAMDKVSALLSLDIAVSGLKRLPASGRVIVAVNHPTGIADGIAVFDALIARRPDLCFFANRDAIRVSRRFEEVLIPVEWVAAKRTRQRSRETLVVVKAAFEGERCIVLFPSGRLAFMDDERRLTEQEWMTSIAILARKYACPVVPMHILARNSRLYYWFRSLSPELRDITLFNELLNKRGKRFDIAIGETIGHEQLAGDPALVTAAMRAHVLDGVRAGRPWAALAGADDGERSLQEAR